MSDYGIIPSSGEYGTDWPAHHVLTQGKEGSISSAGWTEGNEGFIQQTFLGASISRFNVSAGFGDSSSSLSVTLVNDEFNKSDGLTFSQGDDVYHNGKQDFFKPPVVGTPVFFKFGKNFATVEQAYRRTLDDLTGYKTIADETPFEEIEVTGPLEEVLDHHVLKEETTNSQGVTTYTFIDKSPLHDPTYDYRGKDHFVFGGILQGWSQGKGAGGQTYDVRVTDPREILSNVSVLLNNYQGTTFNNKNLINAYGYLEYDVSDDLKEELEGTEDLPNPSLISKSILTKEVDVSGVVRYTGDDTYNYETHPFVIGAYPSVLPITGQGFSRRGDQGIPWYRVDQALTALFNYNGNLPEEYELAGFGGPIDFRGFKYVVDFSGIPLHLIPKMYFIDFDQIDLLSLAQELCDVISHDLFVTLLPVIDHPSNEWLWNYNQSQIQLGNYSNIITGIIRIDSIDRSQQPEYGAVRQYLNNLKANGTDVISENLGFELSNVTTDKFVVGAQEVSMYYFNNNRDRNNLQLRRKNNGLANDFEFIDEIQWSLNTSFKQQILPFYGFLGEDAVTIPRGFGSYQQIMLDSSSLNADGVGNYYIATEIELRHVLKSYDDWVLFLSQYNDMYLEDTGDFNNSLYKNYEAAQIQWMSIDDFNKSAGSDAEIERIQAGSYAVGAPRCVFNSDKNYMGDDGFPASPCSPPYGYPLYYKRAEKIGTNIGSQISWKDKHTHISTHVDKLKARLVKKLENDGVKFNDITALQRSQILVRNLNGEGGGFKPPEALVSRYKNEDIEALAAEYDAINQDILVAQSLLGDNPDFLDRRMNELAANGRRNARKVYDFLRATADKHFGRSFLVKVPNLCNLSYATGIDTNDAEEISRGPYGFKPNPINSGIDYSNSILFNTEVSGLLAEVQTTDFTPAGAPADGPRETFTHYLDNDAAAKYTYGALKGNFNTISENWEFNYEPSVDGGFFDFEIFDRPVMFSSGVELDEVHLPPVIRQMIAPKDMSNIVQASRVSCYVRFDHSENLDFSDIDSSSFAQQTITTDGAIPDILETLDNTGDVEIDLDRHNRLLNDGRGVIPDSCMYVKCDLDSKLYMAPKNTTSGVLVYGRDVQFHTVHVSVDKYYEIDDDGNEEMRAMETLLPIFTPSQSGIGGGADGYTTNNDDFVRIYDSELDALIVDTEKNNLDPNNTYALITLPGRVKPNKDLRYLDAIAYARNATHIKHSMAQDVVRGPDGFQKPAPMTFSPNNTTISACGENINLFNFVNAARKAQLEAASDTSVDGSYNPELTQFSQPSPVYPDLIAIPMISKERCYGPWMSASIINPSQDNRIRYSNIGGKVEFVKDESLAPWNFGGYQLMNEAGKLQAQFSNSLKLLSERGDFSIPEAPTGIALGTALIRGGPLVTSIDVSISNDGYKTNVKMELYSSNFGKLQKQKEEAIAKIGRERQRIIDQNNAMMRKGLGKNQSKQDFLAPFRSTGDKIITASDTLTASENSRRPEKFVVVKNRVVKDGKDSDTGEPVKKVVDSTAVRMGRQNEDRSNVQSNREAEMSPNALVDYEAVIQSYEKTNMETMAQEANEITIDLGDD